MEEGRIRQRNKRTEEASTAQPVIKWAGSERNYDRAYKTSNRITSGSTSGTIRTTKNNSQRKAAAAPPGGLGTYQSQKTASLLIESGYAFLGARSGAAMAIISPPSDKKVLI